MSESKKYVTFRDLKDLNQPDNTAIKAASTTSTSRSPSNTSIPSTTSISRSSSNTSTSSSDDQPPKSFTKTGDKQRRSSNKSIVPERDFQRVPNSITREALQKGLFRGKSKQVWDYLWSISRGAVVPTRIIRKSRKEIKSGSGLGSMVTVDAAIEHLKNLGLLVVRLAIGSMVGNEYEIFTIEEASIPSSRYTSTSSISSSTSLTHKVDVLDILDSGISSITQPVENSVGYGPPNTFFNTIDDDDDDTHTLLNYFSETLLRAASEVVGGKLKVSEQERVLWNECACVLADELKTAAERAETISSVPAFLAAHLRRRFAKKTKADKRNTDQNSKPPPVPKIEATANNKATSAEINPKSANASKFTLGECRRYAEHLQKTGQGITNPGGYATTIYRTGEADALIEKFLNPERHENEDISRCPDCKGMGFTYPEGIDRGVVAKCKHPRLSNALKILEEINRLQALHTGDSSYQFSDMKEDLRFWCEREGVTDDQQLIDILLEPYA